MKRFLGILIAFLFVLTFAHAALAGEMPVRRDCIAINMDGSWQDYNLEVNEYAYCPITIAFNGRLDVSVQTCFDNMHYVYLLDQNYETISYASVYGSGEASPEVTRFTFDLTAGAYYIRVESWNDCSGVFRIKAGFTPSTAPTPDGGSSFQTAADYAPAIVTGFVSSSGLPSMSQNPEDYYKFNAEKGAYSIIIAATDPESSLSCEIYDSAYQPVRTVYSYNGAAEVELNDGVYYTRVLPENALSGDYLLKIDKK